MNESRESKNAEQLEELLLLTEEIQEELEPVSYTHLFQSAIAITQTLYMMHLQLIA